MPSYAEQDAMDTTIELLWPDVGKLWHRITDAMKNDKGERGKALAHERVLRCCVEFVRTHAHDRAEAFDAMTKLRLFDRLRREATKTLALRWHTSEDPSKDVSNTCLMDEVGGSIMCARCRSSGSTSVVKTCSPPEIVRIYLYISKIIRSAILLIHVTR